MNEMQLAIPLDHHHIIYAVTDAYQHTLQLHSCTRQAFTAYCQPQ